MSGDISTTVNGSIIMSSSSSTLTETILNTLSEKTGESNISISSTIPIAVQAIQQMINNTINKENPKIPISSPTSVTLTDKAMQIASISVFYFAILLVGVWASKKAEKKAKSVRENSSPDGFGSGSLKMGSYDEADDVMLAGRSIGLVVGIFTMTATWVGGAYICGTAEVAYSSGLIWVQGPFGFALSLFLGGLLFAVPMREQGYVTMLDPFQLKYGEKFGALIIIPAIMGEVFWTAAILIALGSTVKVILELDKSISIVISACIAIGYTLAGGLYSVAYTDVIQLICILLGLLLAIPVTIVKQELNLSDLFGEKTIPSVTYPLGVGQNATDQVEFYDWLGEVGEAKGLWWDLMLLIIFGGIPWQVYFQRVLSCDTAQHAKTLSYRE